MAWPGSIAVHAVRRRLGRLIMETGAFAHSPEKPFVLASGRTSPFYFDMRRLNAHPEGLHLAAHAILEQVPEQARSVGGMETGAIPLATAVSLESRGTGSRLKSFWVRKSPKSHGTGRLMEGILERPYILVDDVITTGSSVLRALEAVGDGYAVMHTMLFRGSDRDRTRLEEAAPLHAIFTQDELVAGVED